MAVERAEGNAAYLKAKTKEAKALAEYEKAKTQSAEAISAAGPQIEGFMMVMSMMKDLDPGFMEAFTDFITIFSDAFKAGLGSSLTLMSDVLFSPAVVAVVEKLAEAGSGMMEDFLRPFLKLFEKLIPLTERFMPLVEKILGRFETIYSRLANKIIPIMDRLLKRMEPFYPLLDKFTDVLLMALEPLEFFVDTVIKFIDIIATLL